MVRGLDSGVTGPGSSPGQRHRMGTGELNAGGNLQWTGITLRGA